MSGLHNAVSLSAELSSHPRPLLYLTALLVSLATCAFLLQWHGGLRDPDIDGSSFLEMGLSERDISSVSTSGDCADLLGRSKEPSFPYYSWRPRSGPGLSHKELKICVTSTTSAGLEQILPWIIYHKIIGITHFLLFVEGKAESDNVARVLESIPEVKLVYRTEELEEQQAKSRIWNETWLTFFFNKPCNYELFVKQNLNMEMAIAMAREAGMDWIIHMDTDELLHPAGTRNYSVQELLSEVPHNIDMVMFPGYESCVERDNIKEPFSEVSLFKKNYVHLPEATYYKYYKDVIRGNPNYTLTYGIWKSGVRIQDDLRPNGSHGWTKYRNKTNATLLEEAAVLHYTYAKFTDLTSRRNRCNCKPTREDAKRCLMLNFDRNAFIIASTSTEQEMLDWYDKHVVWSDTEVKAKLLRAGVLERIYAPMVIVQGLKESDIFADIIASAWKKQPNPTSTS